MKIGQLLLSLISDIGLWAEYFTEPNPYGEATIDTLPEPLGASKDQIPRKSMYSLYSKNTTYLKDQPAPSADLCADCISIAKETEFEADVVVHVAELHHSYIALANAKGGETRWWVYTQDWKFTGTDEGNNPTESIVEKPVAAPPPKLPEPKKFYVPGISAELHENMPIFVKGKPTNFTWREATMGGTRIPVDSGVTQRIIKAAEYMQAIREHLGNKPIIVTSWYRDPVSNRRVGGAKFSEHLKGWAVDFYVVGEDVVDTFYKLKGFARGGLAPGSGFVHVDLGAPGRWTYPGGPVVSLW